MSRMNGGKVWLTAYANDNTALIPEVWAQESLMFLENNMIAGMLVHRDFKNEVAKFGDVVNTRRPAGFTAVRKVDGDNVTVQDASLTNVAVRMDQHWHTSFIIYDGEETVSMKSLIETHLTPAMSSIAQSVDQVVCTEAYNFMTISAGKLGTALTQASVINLREALTNAKCPIVGRNMLLTPNSEGQLLAIGDLVNANTVGDEGSALRAGNLGTKYGFTFFTDQNMPTIASGNTVATGGEIANGAGYPIGTTVVAVDGYTGTGTRVLGSFCTIEGDMTPQRIVAVDTSSAGNLNELTLSPGLRYAVADNADITIYTPGSINNSPSGYAAQWVKSIVLNNFSVAPKSGQLIAFGTASDLYGAVGVPTTTGITVNRSLDAAVAHAANVAIGPAGNYNFGFHKNAISLVSRPLAMPIASTGVKSAVVSYNGLTIRASIGYDIYKQGHLVTVDLLAGIKTLDTNLGGVLFG